MSHERKIALFVGFCIATLFSVAFWIITGLYPDGDPFLRVVSAFVLPLACFLTFPWIACSFTVF